MTEPVTVKAKRFLRERRDRIRITESSDEAITALIQGDTAVYEVTIVCHGPDNRTYDCTCPATITCSHLLALEGWRLVKNGEATWEEVTR